MNKITVVWSGWTGAPGYSNFYFWGDGDGAQISTSAARVRTFFDSIKGILPSSVTLTFNSGSQRVTEGDGGISTEDPLTTVPLPVVGTAAGAFASPVGACVIWRALGTVNNRSVKGKTFLVPLSVNAYQSDGSIIDTSLTLLRNAATVLATPPAAVENQLVVWHRPTGGTGGSKHQVVSATVPDRAAVLKSRRQ